MIQRLTERDLIRKARELARRTRCEIDDAGLALDDFDGVSRAYGIDLVWDEMLEINPGCYIKEQKKIILDPSVQSPERLNFTFFHELMHDRIEHDDNLLTLIADAHIGSDEAMIERLCNVGAAELLIPVSDLQQVVHGCGFSTSLIPILCDRYDASSIAVAFKMISTASHDCYLVIAEPQYVPPDDAKLPMLVTVPPASGQWKLVITYTATSPSIQKYSIKTGQVVPTDHHMYAAWHRMGNVIRGPAKIPFASGRGWEVDSDALYYRNKVFAFFHASPPISPNQLRLL